MKFSAIYLESYFAPDKLIDMNITSTQIQNDIKSLRNQEEETFVQRVANRLNVPYIDLSGVGIETDALSVLSQDEAMRAQIAPFKISDKRLDVAVRSPQLPETRDKLSELSKKYKIYIYLASTKSLQKAWDRYEDVTWTTKSDVGLVNLQPEVIEKTTKNVRSNDDIRAQFEEMKSSGDHRNITNILALFFGGAIATDASDIHFEPRKNDVRLRLRQDGILNDITFITPEIYDRILSRLKLLSGVKLMRERSAQDGRFTIGYQDTEIEVRTSIAPSIYGEGVVMRLLNPKNIRVGVENLGMQPNLLKILSKQIQKPNGMILNTGPTGSGKTTTLYSFLQKIYSPEKKIMTIEDPVEYHLEGISQTQVNREKNYGFLNGLRAALRQDPEIIMVGEIRDTETARIAVNASLTGHLVLSTLHTNDAAGVIPRLLDLGVQPQILAAALSTSIAQRLVRKICNECRQAIRPNIEQENVISAVMKNAEQNKKDLRSYGIDPDGDIMLYRGVGCQNCNGSGYRGRVGIFEAIITDESIEKLLAGSPTEQQVREVAKQQGILNMTEDGVIKILTGVTSYEEVASAVDIEASYVEQFAQKQPPTELARVPRNKITNTPHEKLHTSPGKINPVAVLGGTSNELELLIDYWKHLEAEQKLDSNQSAESQIRKIKNTILGLLYTRDPAEIFTNLNIHDHNTLHTSIARVASDLDRLEQEQRQDPKKDISKDLQRLRQEIQSGN